jgi:adenine phosphoribosyltransferase
MLDQLRVLIRDVPDFPKPGILFKDITPLLADAAGLCLAVELMANPFRKERVDLVCGAESRGFIFGTAIAGALGKGFIPIRKPGKLPSKRVRAEYALEYGTDALEMHEGSFADDARVLIVDDLVATGGTAKATAELVEKVGGRVAGFAFVIELGFLEGARRLAPHPVHSILRF